MPNNATRPPRKRSRHPPLERCHHRAATRTNHCSVLQQQERNLSVDERKFDVSVSRPVILRIMSESISRQTSPRVHPMSASPSRPSPLSRPHWPYSTYTHRSSSSSIHSPHSSASSIPALLDTRGASSGSGSVTPSPSAVKRTPNITGSSGAPPYDTMNTRHWNFNVSSLHDHCHSCIMTCPGS